MSKERELLKRFMTELNTEEDVVSLFNDIKECLAQPEQEPEQEPVAWITEWVQRYRHNDAPIIDRAVSFTKGDAPAVPNPNYIPLYLAPPKRKPLTPQQISSGNQSMLNVTREAFKQGVIFAEKAHGIGGEE